MTNSGNGNWFAVVVATAGGGLLGWLAQFVG